ncbi:ammonia-dependent NAD(+) synthetase [Planococcus maitriensis]|uniref:NH(3)-dependent NAD(+) synthetase n=1 Tax=Planococcus maitriensis TaxID=221799 RepID=A0A365K193_9BACL|nr:ammonia-dependent NAD(+) synthetase [Planococcus maitriensis]RAZ66424.1 NAD(+) synthase [Planococcus maitriensis]
MSTLQQQIINELKVQPSINPQEEVKRTVEFLKEYLKHHSFLKGFVLGISGGQDSTLAGKLAQMAVDELNEEEGGQTYGFYGVRLPYGVQFDEHDARDAIDFIKPTKIYTINIKEAVDASDRALEAEGIELTDFAKGNEKARERMKAQYSVAAMHDAVVLGTDHAAEAITGFYTKYGDGAADVMPLFRLNKRQGREMLKALGSPEHLYTKVPTADLEEDKPAIPDEVALGITYDQIDDYLEGKEIPSEAREKLEGYYLKTQHKRHLPVTIFDDFWKNN